MREFIMGAMTVLFSYALFSSYQPAMDQDEFEEMENDVEEDEAGPTGRNVTLSCQTCRKLKKHKEIKPNLFQCVKCKRHVDLRH